MDEEQSEYMSVAEVADKLNVSPMTIYREIHVGRLPTVRVGRMYRIPRSSFTSYLNTHIYNPVSQA